MKTIVILTALLASVMTAPAWAGDPTYPGGDAAARTAVSDGSTDLDLQLKLGGERFRLGARLFGPTGVAGAWLNGEIGPDGFALDGRVQRDDGRAWTFRFDAELDDEVGGLGWQWLRGCLRSLTEGEWIL